MTTQDWKESRCPTCGIIFGLSSSYMEHRKEDHKSLFCPNGHIFYYPGETETERLRREKDSLQVKLQGLERLLPHRGALGRFIKRKE